MRVLVLCLMLAGGLGGVAMAEDPLLTRVTHGYADNDGVKIHYVSLGEGPVLLFVHGFPDFWYSWRHQMNALSDAYRCVAIDQRGYNESDRPAGVEQYKTEVLARDVVAVVGSLGVEKVVLIGHDWGGAVAWQVAMSHPEVVERLVILNLPHPRGLSRELAHNPEQQKNSSYAQAFKQPEAHKVINPELLASMVAQNDAAAFEVYKVALEKSDVEAMLNYYKANYPDQPYEEITAEMPQVQAPTLAIHGLDDKALHANGWNGTWQWIDAPFTLMTVPKAGHWVHVDAAERVNKALRDFLR